MNLQHFQFWCSKHQYGWNVNEDGVDRGCPECENDIEMRGLSTGGLETHLLG